MNWGFTGTSVNVTLPQQLSFGMFILERFKVGDEFHHGDCIEADQIAHQRVRHHAPGVIIHGHPPIKDEKRAWCEFDRIELPKSYFARNRDIVDSSELLLAMPLQMYQMPTGGTWYTINYARKKHRPIYIFWPDGSIGVEGV